MYYPDEVIEEVRSSNNIVDVIGSYVRLQKKGSSYFGLCPFHNEKSPSFSVSPPINKCIIVLGCGAGGAMYLPLLWNMRIRRFRGYESTGRQRGIRTSGSGTDRRTEKGKK